MRSTPPRCPQATTHWGVRLIRQPIAMVAVGRHNPEIVRITESIHNIGNRTDRAPALVSRQITPDKGENDRPVQRETPIVSASLPAPARPQGGVGA